MGVARAFSPTADAADYILAPLPGLNEPELSRIFGAGMRNACLAPNYRIRFLIRSDVSRRTERT